MSLLTMGFGGISEYNKVNFEAKPKEKKFLNTKKELKFNDDPKKIKFNYKRIFE
jgi:hypothetical protein